MLEKISEKEILEKNLKEIENISKQINNFEIKTNEKLYLIKEFFDLQNTIYKMQKEKNLSEIDNFINLALAKSDKIIELIGKENLIITNNEISYTFKGLNIYKKYIKGDK